MRERACLKIKQRDVEKETDVDLWPIHVYIQMCAHRHTELRIEHSYFLCLQGPSLGNLVIPKQDHSGGLESPHWGNLQALVMALCPNHSVSKGQGKWAAS